jgi:hypothetical protein
LEVIEALEKILPDTPSSERTALDIVINLRKMGYKIVKVDDGE